MCHQARISNKSQLFAQATATAQNCSHHNAGNARRARACSPSVTHRTPREGDLALRFRPLLDATSNFDMLPITIGLRGGSGIRCTDYPFNHVRCGPHPRIRIWYRPPRPLARIELNVHGVERSAEMVAKAQAATPSAMLASGGSFTCEVGNIRWFEF